MKNQILSSQDSQPKLKSKKFKSDLLLALKNVATLKLLNGIYYSEMDRNLLKGIIQSLADQIIEFVNLKYYKKKDKMAPKRHNRIATESSVASSMFSFSLKSIKNGLSKALSIRRGNTTVNYSESLRASNNGSSAISTSSIHNSTPSRKRLLNLQMFGKKNLQNSYTKLFTIIVDHLVSRKSELQPKLSANYKEEIVKGLINEILF